MDRETIEALRDPGHRDEGAHQVRAKACDPERFTCGWCATTSQLAVLIEYPDAATGARVRALGGAHVTAVTPTVLRLDAKTREHRLRGKCWSAPRLSEVLQPA
jgi:hypothetical protein